MPWATLLQNKWTWVAIAAIGTAIVLLAVYHSGEAAGAAAVTAAAAAEGSRRAAAARKAASEVKANDKQAMDVDPYNRDNHPR